jgi:AefR-like transcriptional repressor, C-terminal domain
LEQGLWPLAGFLEAKKRAGEIHVEDSYAAARFLVGAVMGNAVMHLVLGVQDLRPMDMKIFAKTVREIARKGLAPTTKES